MSSESAVADPGWRSALKYLPAILVPVLGLRILKKSDDGLIVLRGYTLSFGLAQAVLAVPVLFLDLSDGALSSSTAVGAVAVIGTVSQLLFRRFRPPLSFASELSTRTDVQGRFFLSMAMANVAALAGFVFFVSSGERLAYAVGAVLAAAGTFDGAPRRSVVTAWQAEADAAGSTVDVRAALRAGGLTG